MWLLPSFGRAQRCQQTLDSIRACGSASPGLVLVDGDPDPAYTALRLPPHWRLEIAPERRDIGARLNETFARFPDEPWYGFFSDDLIVGTPGWDTRLIAAAGRRHFASPDDSGLGRKLPVSGALVMGGDLVRAFGFWSVPGLRHVYIDNAWQELAGALNNLVYLSDVLIEHRHHHAGKADPDETYRVGAASAAADLRVYQTFCETGLREVVARARRL